MRHALACSIECLYFTLVFCCRKEFNIDVLKCFIDLHDFTSKSLVDAIK